MVLGLLEDPQLEVRELAATTLAGLVRATEDDSFLHHVRRVSLDKASTLQASALRARQRKRQQARAVAAGNDGGATHVNGGSSAAVAEPTLAQRHGPILGLVALVQSSPYSVPAWLPEVVSRLAGERNTTTLYCGSWNTGSISSH